MAFAFCILPGVAGAQSPRGRELKAAELQHINTDHCLQEAYTTSRDGRQLSFSYACDIQNGTDLQLSEVDLALVFFDNRTRKETFRSAPVRFTEFDNRRIPHTGGLESGSDLASIIRKNFVCPPDEWRTDVTPRLIPVRAIAAPEPGDLHEVGNLIQFIKGHTEKDVLAAIEQDPAIAGAKDSKGTTACLVAVAYATPAVVKEVIAKGGDLHARATTGEDALFYAIAGNNPTNLQFLRDQGFAPDHALPNGETTLQRAITQGAEKSVEWLCSHGADLNELDSMGFVPLMQAIFWHDLTAFDLLSKAGADPFRRSRSQVTIMHIAAVYDARFLPQALSMGVPIDDASPPNDVTPLMLAAASQSNESARWLLDHGAHGKAVAKNGWGVLEFAQQSNTLHTDEFFLRAVGDPTRWHAKYPPKKPDSVAPSAPPTWKDGVLRFDCGLGSFQSDLKYAPPVRGALQPNVYTISLHLRTPFDLHEWSTACADTTSHSRDFPNIAFYHVGDTEQVIWKTTVPVAPNTVYLFTAWAYGVSDPLRSGSSLVLRVNGTDSDRSYLPFSHWGKVERLWSSGNSNSATLEIVSEKEPKDQVFGISDISLTKL